MKWIFRGIALILFLILASLVLLYVTRANFLNPYLQKELPKLVEKNTGTRIVIGYLGGNYFTHMEVRNIRTLKAGNRSLVRLDLKNLRLRYQVRKLLKGMDAFLGTLEIQGQDGRLDLNLAASGAKHASPKSPSRGGPMSFPTQWPVVDFRNLALRIAGPEFRLGADQLSLQLRQHSRLDLQVRTVSVRHPLVGDKTFPLVLQLHRQNQRLVVDRLSMGDFLVMEKASADLGSLRSGKADFQAAFRIFGGHCGLEGNRKPGWQQVRLRLDAIDLKQATSFFHFGFESPGQLTLEAQAGLHPNQWDSLQGTATLGVHRAEVAGVAVTSLKLVAEAGAGQIQVTQLTVVSGRNRLQASHLRVPSEALFRNSDQSWQEASGTFHARISDLSSLGLASILRQSENSIRIDGRLEQGRLVISRGAVEMRTLFKSLRLGPAAYTAGESADPENNLKLRNFSVPLGDLIHGRMQRLFQSARLDFTLRLADLADLLALAGLNPEQSRELGATSFLLQGTVENGRVVVRQGGLTARGLRLEIRRAVVVLPKSGSLNEAQVDCELWIRAPDLRSLAAWPGMPQVQGALAAKITFRGRLLNPAGSLVLRIDRLVSTGQGLFASCSSLEARVASREPVRALHLDGSLRLQGGELRPEAAGPAINDLSATILLQGTRVRLQDVKGALGGSYFTLTGELVQRGEPMPFVNIRLRGDNLLLYRDTGVKVRADTDLTVRGPWDRWRVTGSMALTESRFVENFDFLDFLKGSGKPQAEAGFQLFSLTDPPLKNAHFRVHIASRDPFVIKSNLVTGQVRPDLMLTGTGEVPQLIGTVYIDPTRVSLPSGTLQIQSGFVRFLETQPDQPQINLSGQSLLQGYQLTLEVTGAISNPTLSVSSNPPLPEDQAVMLVLTGTPPPTQAGENQTSSTAVNLAVFLGVGYFSKLFGTSSTESGETFMDRFQLGIGQNYSAIPVDQGNNQGNNTNQTIQASYLLARNLLLKKDDFYLTSEKDIYGDYNLGVKEVFRFK